MTEWKWPKENVRKKMTERKWPKENDRKKMSERKWPKENERKKMPQKMSERICPKKILLEWFFVCEKIVWVIVEPNNMSRLT
jgi:hypothetical protein